VEYQIEDEGGVGVAGSGVSSLNGQTTKHTD
jgi:hypothetical protein